MNSRVRYWNGRACQAPAELPLPTPPAAGGRDPPGDPGGGPAAVRAAGLPGHHHGAGRGRGRGGPQDRLSRLRDQERAAAGPVGPAPEGRPGGGGRGRAALVPGGRRGAGPRAPAAGQRPQRPPGQGAHRRRPEDPAVGGAGGPRRRGAVAPDPDRLLRQPARDRGVPGGQAGAATGPGRRPGQRHPVDAQPPGRVAAAGRRARLDPRAVGAMVRRHRLRAAAAGEREVPGRRAASRSGIVQAWPTRMCSRWCWPVARASGWRR